MLYISSALSLDEVLQKIKQLDALAVEPCASGKIELAYELAKHSFEQNKNIANDVKLEMLLWLAKKTDILRSSELTRPKTSKNILLIMFSSNEEEILNLLKAKKIRTRFVRPNTDLELEEIALSRV